MNNNSRYLVCGSGAVGILVGTRLAEGAHDVTFLVRNLANQGPITLEDLARGLTVTIKSPRLFTEASLDGAFDVIFICGKTSDLEQICSVLLDHVHENSVIIPLQNGINMDKRTSQLLPRVTVLSGTLYANVSRTESTKATLLAEPRIILGASQQGWEDAHNVCSTLLGCHLQTRLSNEPEKEQWIKFVFLTAFSVITASTGETVGEIMSGVLKHDLFCAIDEGLEVARKVGGLRDTHSLRDLFISRLETQSKNIPGATSSLSLDVTQGKLGELEDLSGHLIHLGNEAGISLPTHGKHYRNIKQRILDSRRG
jgi:2-dehydropantoate 2-reductase